MSEASESGVTHMNYLVLYLADGCDLAVFNLSPLLSLFMAKTSVLTVPCPCHPVCLPV